mgnify:CR=1 FL=1|tara:strand:- start:381 stop:713 length:333 start_codon:yes stop_codon:yes gene_type:complete
MSRLLFAAARGARIQHDWCGEWINTGFYPVIEYARPHRIHPDDAHLAYGPISTALRDLAMQGMVMEITTDWEFVARYYFMDIAWEKVPNDVEHRSFFLLILAEALADEGL